jgi:hypothetical protein
VVAAAPSIRPVLTAKAKAQQRAVIAARNHTNV